MVSNPNYKAINSLMSHKTRRLFTGVIFRFRELFPYFSRHIVELIPASERYAQRTEAFLLMTFFSQISSLFSSGSFFSFLI
jgi:hypothetical protein